MAIVACRNISLRSFALLYTYGKGKRFSALAELLSDGNMKLPNTTAIFNMSSAHDCPSMKLGLCKAVKQGAKCYAKKAEHEMWPQVLPHRRKQGEYWQTVTAQEFVSQFILINANKRIPWTNIRFNESGDFHNQAELDKTELIAKLLRRFGIRCYCYTSRSDLDFSRCRHLIVSGSGFIKRGISNEFKIIGKKEKVPKGYGLCKGNCRVCRRCLMKNLKTCVRRH